jgi:hypothetical protein
VDVLVDEEKITKYFEEAVEVEATTVAGVEASAGADVAIWRCGRVNGAASAVL